MFNKLLQKVTSPQPPPSPKEGSLTRNDLDPRVTVHYGIPSTASVLAFDPVQRLLAVGTLDGRIKVIGGDNIEGLFVSPKQLPFKNLEFLRNQGFLVSVSNENEIQVWDLEHRGINSTFRWESNITAFSVGNSGQERSPGANMPLSTLNQIVSRIQRVCSSNAPPSLTRIQRDGSNNAPSSLPLNSSSVGSRVQLDNGVNTFPHVSPSNTIFSNTSSTGNISPCQNSLHSLHNCDKPLSNGILPSPPAHINAAPDLPVPTMSSLPINFHPMITRSKNSIFKPKVLNSAIDISCYLVDLDPTTAKAALKDPKWVQAM
ncbi:hypothetical protein LWI29_038019 [Acer saccharum]|uniref:Uncharacterized protein n=1 Tax=Acer saccharum TaxID=4024 RepID=A0AA39VKR3_ACESA|nr:hypothetical protein LWI29_038019 [Acer saccharum]